MSDNQRIVDLEAAVIALKEEILELRAELASLSSLDFNDEE